MLNIWGLCLNFVDPKSFLESNSPDILALYETNLDGLIDFGNFFNFFNFFNSSIFLSFFNLKRFYHPYAWSHIVCEGRTSFCMELVTRKLSRYLAMLSTGFTSLSVLLLFPLLINFFIFMHRFWFISFNIDEVPSISPYTTAFVFGELIIHHKDRLTYSGGTDGPGELENINKV